MFLPLFFYDLQGSQVINEIQNVIAVIEGVDEPDR